MECALLSLGPPRGCHNDAPPRRGTRGGKQAALTALSLSYRMAVHGETSYAGTSGCINGSLLLPLI